MTPAQAKLIKKIMAGEIRSGKQVVTSNRSVNLAAFAMRNVKLNAHAIPRLSWHLLLPFLCGAPRSGGHGYASASRARKVPQVGSAEP